MQALNGLRMLDLTHMVSGPYASLMLADLGMEVIKVEPPGRGEISRHLLATDPDYNLHGMSAYFFSLNRNKRSLTLDLKSEAGREIFYELVEQCDVVIENFSTGVAARLGIDHERLFARNPAIVTCSISGFGETGPQRDFPAYDMVAQAISGMMSITGHPGSPPVRSGTPLADLTSGLFAAIGILAALNGRHETGRGQHVDIAMLDGQVSLLSYMATMFLMSGRVPGLNGNEHFLHVPYDTYPASDGYIILAVITDEFWRGLMRAVDAPALDTDENQKVAGRQRNRHNINSNLSDIFRTNTRAHWLEKLRAERVPCAPINDFAEAFNNPQLAVRDMVIELEHPDGGVVRTPGNPVKLSDGGPQKTAAPPLLGADTDAILSDLLGKSDDEINALRGVGVV